MNILAFCIIISVSLVASGQDAEKNLICPGGYCVSKHLCPNGTYIDDPERAQDTMLIGLRMFDDCMDYLLVCCPTAPATAPKSPIDNAGVENSCGIGNENGLAINLHNNDTLAQYAEFPWVVYIFTRAAQTGAFTNRTDFVCGGTLFHPRFVVTTAHNTEGKTDLVARFGEWDISTKNEPYPQQEINVQEIFKHPQYVRNPIQNDIALLLLADNVRYYKHIRPICLPGVEDNFVGQRCISNGWGTNGGVYANVMKKISLPMIDHANCTRMLRYAGLGPRYKLREGFLCAGGEANVDMCKGDGGSPLACQREDGSYVLAGIVSWGIGCGGVDLPGVYVAVNKYVKWISEQVVEGSIQEIDDMV